MTDSTLDSRSASAPLSCLIATLCSVVATLGFNALLVIITASTGGGWPGVIMQLSIVPLNVVLIGLLMVGELMLKRYTKGASSAPYVIVSVLLPGVAAFMALWIISGLNLPSHGC